MQAVSFQRAGKARLGYKEIFSEISEDTLKDPNAEKISQSIRETPSGVHNGISSESMRAAQLRQRGNLYSRDAAISSWKE